MYILLTMLNDNLKHEVIPLLFFHVFIYFKQILIHFNKIRTNYVIIPGKIEIRKFFKNNCIDKHLYVGS